MKIYSRIWMSAKRKFWISMSHLKLRWFWERVDFLGTNQTLFSLKSIILNYVLLYFSIFSLNFFLKYFGIFIEIKFFFSSFFYFLSHFKFFLIFTVLLSERVSLTLLSLNLHSKTPVSKKGILCTFVSQNDAINFISSTFHLNKVNIRNIWQREKIHKNEKNYKSEEI